MAVNTALFDERGRVIRPVLFNTAKDGSGTWYFAIVDSDGQLQVDVLSITAGDNVIGKVRLVDSAGDEITDATLDAVKQISKANIEVILHPFAKGNLTEDGVQYSALYTTGADDYEVVETVTVNIPGLGTPDEIEFGLTGSFQSSSTAEDVLFKWEGSDNNSSWLALHTEVTYAANASVLKEYTMSGRFVPTGNFAVTTTPIYLRLSIKSGTAGTETAKGKTKNSSYVKLIYRA